MKTFYGIKKDQTQVFDKSGKRLFITKVLARPATVIQIKTEEKDGYSAIQVGLGTKKRITKPLKGHLNSSGITKVCWLREIKTEKDDQIKRGEKIIPGQIFKVGDTIMVSGTMKGRGFAGVMKRWGFAGGPKTHGQSDRQRAPGSIGCRTDPGRVWKGKKMAGHMGNVTKTIKGLQVVKIDDENGEIWMTGAIPGSKGGLVKIQKTGEKKFIGLYEGKPKEKAKATINQDEKQIKDEKKDKKGKKNA